MRNWYFFQRTIRILIPSIFGIGLAWAFVGASKASSALLSSMPVDPVGAILKPQFTAAAKNPLLVSADAHSLVLELSTPDFELETGADQAQPCQVIRVHGYGETEEPGQPRLPVKGAMLGIPALADPTATILEADFVDSAEKYDLCPVSMPVIEQASPGEPLFGVQQASRDVQIYSLDRFIPGDLVKIVATGHIRSQRIAQLRFQPFQYNPATGELRYYRRIRVRLDFIDIQRGAPSSAAKIEEGQFEDLLRKNLINYDQAQQWRAQFKPDNQPALQSNFQQSSSFKILVDQQGINQVTYDQVVSAGVPVSTIDPRTFRLLNRGQEAAILVSGEQDGSFDPGDFLLFYGQPAGTRFTDTNVYWLSCGNGNGLRMAELDGTPGGQLPASTYFSATTNVEENHSYWAAQPSGPERDRWYWNMLITTSTPVSQTYSFALHNIYDASPDSAIVRGFFYGYYASPMHHTQVYLNDYLVDDAYWPSMAEYSFQAEVPIASLLEGSNTLEVKLPGGHIDYVLVNHFELDYFKKFIAENDSLDFIVDEGAWEFQIDGFTNNSLAVFDITDPLAPASITGGVVEPLNGFYRLRFDQSVEDGTQILALSSANWLHPSAILPYTPTDLHSLGNGADYIIITHPDFYTDIQPLANFRAAQDLRTMVVDVNDIYDEFGYGLFDPEAIKSFLAYAYQSWVKPAPGYVLLVGDGNYDFKNFTGRGEPNYVPPYLADVDHWLGETAADNRYVSVSGEDYLPDMYLGRLPVRTSTEAAGLVSKIISYDQSTPVGGWNKRLLFVADNADSGGNFGYYSDTLIQDTLPSDYEAQRVHYLVTHSDPIAARNAITTTMNQGVLLVNYIGHATFEYWASERLLNIPYIPGLDNAGHLPLMVPMTCLDGYFIDPLSALEGRPSLGESIVRAAPHGAIASFSPTGMGTTYGHDYLNRGLFIALFENNITELGPATAWAKYYLYSQTSAYLDLIETYTLFGDPATSLKVLRPDVKISKSVQFVTPIDAGDTITFTLTYSNSGARPARQVVIRDDLPQILTNPSVTSSGAEIILRPNSQFTWDVSDLGSGEGGIITITAQLSQWIGGVLTNTSLISAIEEDPNLPTDSSSASFGQFFFPLIYR